MTSNKIQAPSTVSGGSFQLFEDFIPGFSGYLPSSETKTGTGAINFPNADDADYDGLGIVEFVASTDGTGLAQYSPGFIFDGSMNPRFEIRIKLPSTPANVGVIVGLSNDTDHGAVFSYAEDDTNWTTQVLSSSTSDSDTAAAAITAGWHILRIEIDDDTAARFYIDGTLVSTLTGVGAVPTANEEIGLFIKIQQATGGAESVFIDWIKIWGNRL